MADDAVLKISVRGLRENARRYREGEKVAQGQIRAATDASAQAGLRLLQDAAPERSGRLKRELRVTRARGQGTISAQIESVAEDRGFAYTVVTRRGRRGATATKASRPSKALGKHPKSAGKRAGEFRLSAAALGEFPGKDGNPIFRRRVRAWKPDVDWVEAAQPAVQAESDKIMSEAADNISTFLGRGIRRTVRVGLR